MRPPEDERYALEQTNAINSLLIKNGSPRFGSVSEVRRVVAHAQKGGILDGGLLEIAATLRNFAGLSQWYGLSEHDMMPTDDLFYSFGAAAGAGTPDFRQHHLAGRNGRHCQHHAGDLRRQDPPDRVPSAPNWMPSQNSTTNKFLQDAVVSLRNGRYVVPVRAEYRGEVGGVIHDVSSSGATVFVEPTAVVEANARIMQLRAQEQGGDHRILSAFSAQVGSLEPQFASL